MKIRRTAWVHLKPKRSQPAVYARKGLSSEAAAELPTAKNRTRLACARRYLCAMLLRRVAFPDFCEPCLPSQAEKPPAGAGWLHEIKHDGFRPGDCRNFLLVS